MSEENTYQVTYEPNGRVWTLRPIPKHMFIMFGQMPGSLMEKAVVALSKTGNNEKDFEDEIKTQLSPKQILDAAIFAREAVKYCVIHPRITLAPESEDDISPFELSEDEFMFLTKAAMQGGDTSGLDSFRGRPEQATGNSVNGKKSKRKRK